MRGHKREQRKEVDGPNNGNEVRYGQQYVLYATSERAILRASTETIGERDSVRSEVGKQGNDVHISQNHIPMHMYARVGRAMTIEASEDSRRYSLRPGAGAVTDER